MAPGYWTEHEEYMDRREWRNSKVAECSDMKVVYDRVIREFDAFLAEHGYEGEKSLPGRKKEVQRRLPFSVILRSAVYYYPICGMFPPFVLWHGLVLAPTSVTRW